MNDSKHFVGRICQSGIWARVTLDGACITSVEALPEPSTPAANEIRIAPGFIDLQVNGYGGYDFNCASWTGGKTDEDAPQRIVEHLARAGTAMACPTIVTNSFEGMTQSFQALRRAVESDRVLARVLPTFHMEGPYISGEEGLRGAHPPQFARDPDWEEFCKFQAAAGGRIKLVTLAPERAGSTRFIEKAVASDVAISLGHTGASPDQIREAVAAGASLSTHLGNGSQNLIQRHSNYFFEQLAHDELTACLITDGHHLPPELVKIMTRVKPPEKLVIVSDAVALGGMPPGIYDNGRHEVLPSGKVVLAGTPYLAGAGHLLDVCAANALRWSEIGMPGLARALSSNPARILNLKNTGSVEAGRDADLTIFRFDRATKSPLQIEATILKGEVLFQA